MDFISVSYLNNEQSERIDAFLAGVFPVLARRHWKTACEQGKVKLNNRRTKPGAALRPRDLVSISMEMFPSQKGPEDLEGIAQVIFEDEYVLVVDKANSVHSVGQKLSSSATLSDWIVHYCSSCQGASPEEFGSGLLGRLDYYTSGLLVAAKDSRSWATLAKAQKKERFQKGYVALCQGLVPKGKIDIEDRLVQSRCGTRMEISGTPDEGFSACTRIVSVKHIRGRSSIVQLRGTSFRRHQLRVHMSHLGHPLVGDEKYGSSEVLQDYLPREGFFLHSAFLSFPHPRTKEMLHFESPPKGLDGLENS
jgi:23S rRNA pseudouridine1911/1915/1917 synthase